METIEDLLAQVAALEGRATAGQGAQRALWWYRGQADGAHELRPECLRRRFLEVASRAYPQAAPALRGLLLERALLRDFCVEGAHHLGRIDDRITVYLRARHHGLATRLLDWSLSPLVATFFAVQAPSSERECDGAVFAIDVG